MMMMLLLLLWWWCDSVRTIDDRSFRFVGIGCDNETIERDFVRATKNRVLVAQSIIALRLS
jgi:hypothetical protein